jgi:phosphate transport system substrate-binding protein
MVSRPSGWICNTTLTFFFPITRDTALLREVPDGAIADGYNTRMISGAEPQKKKKMSWFRTIAGALFLVVCLSAVIASAQTASKLSRTRKLCVNSLGEGAAAAATRRDLIRQLQKHHTFQIVADPAQAEAVLEGSVRIWTVSQVSLDTRSRNSVDSVLEGFLSVELIGKDHQILWSYLVTPRRFRWGGISNDLAGQVVERLAAEVQRSSPPQLAAEEATSAAPTTLQGAGATFPAPLYEKWFELFREAHPEVQIRYAAIGSAEGIRELQQGHVDFGASDMPVSNDSFSEGGSEIMQFPMVLGAVVPIYNIKGLRGRINFTPEILAAIYLGKLKKWNDPELKRVNPGLSLPDSDISVVHRSDGSGTTFVFTDYLSKVSPEWKASIGSGVSVNWPVGAGAERNEGVALRVQQTPNSIGYAEFIYALQHELSFGAVRNPAGQFVRANIPSVMAAARASTIPGSNFGVSITNSSSKAAYPIASYTWLLLTAHLEESKRRVIWELLRWMLTSGQKSCSALGYAPLPDEVSERALQVVAKLAQE